MQFPLGAVALEVAPSWQTKVGWDRCRSRPIAAEGCDSPEPVFLSLQSARKLAKANGTSELGKLLPVALESSIPPEIQLAVRKKFLESGLVRLVYEVHPGSCTGAAVEVSWIFLSFEQYRCKSQQLPWTLR